MPMIRCEHLTYVYQPGTPLAVPALTDVSLEIRREEIVGIIGPTGSGKSTLVQHMNGLLRPTSGHVFLDGMDLYGRGVDLHHVRQQIALLFQYPEHQLFEETVSKDVAFGPRNLGLDAGEITGRVRTALDLVGLDPDRFGPRSPFSLSNGEMRRVAIAGLLAMSPSMLILDEPTAGLDPAGRREILAHIVRLHRDHAMTIVLITHSMDAVAQVCERLVVMDGGRLVADGPLRSIFSDAARLVSRGLGVPQAALAAHRLREQGLSLSPDLLTIEETRTAIVEALAGERYEPP
jgi:energy-coupling factor transport system ATP-binding protein